MPQKPKIFGFRAYPLHFQYSENIQAIAVSARRHVLAYHSLPSPLKERVDAVKEARRGRGIVLATGAATTPALKELAGYAIAHRMSFFPIAISGAAALPWIMAPQNCPARLPGA